MSCIKATAELRPTGTVNPDSSKAAEDISASLENKAPYKRC